MYNETNWSLTGVTSPSSFGFQSNLNVPAAYSGEIVHTEATEIALSYEAQMNLACPNLYRNEMHYLAVSNLSKIFNIQENINILRGNGINIISYQCKRDNYPCLDLYINDEFFLTVWLNSNAFNIDNYTLVDLHNQMKRVQWNKATIHYLDKVILQNNFLEYMSTRYNDILDVNSSFELGYLI
jgi:hypothetical protein